MFLNQVKHTILTLQGLSLMKLAHLNNLGIFQGSQGKQKRIFAAVQYINGNIIHMIQAGTY